MIVRFSGSSDISLNNKEFTVPALSLRSLFSHLYKTVTTEYFLPDGTIQDGVLCLLDDIDWELSGCYDSDIKDVGVVTLINTIHGG